MTQEVRLALAGDKSFSAAAEACHADHIINRPHNLQVYTLKI